MQHQSVLSTVLNFLSMTSFRFVGPDGFCFWRLLLPSSPSWRLLTVTIGWTRFPHPLTAACSACAPAFPWLRMRLWCPAARPAAGGCGPCPAGRPRTAPSGPPTPPAAAWRRRKAARFAPGTAPASSWRRSGGIPRSLPPIPTDPETCSGQRAEVTSAARRRTGIRSSSLKAQVGFI